MTDPDLRDLEETASRWTPYPTYKESGVEWLGDVPEYWELLRLKFACQVNPPKSDIAHLPDGYEVSFLPMELIGEDGTLSLTESKALEDVWAGYTYFAEGDVLVAKITPCFENGKSGLCLGLTNEIGFGTTELHVLRPRGETDAKFIFYLTRSTPFRVLGITSMKGVAGQQRVTSDFVEDFWVALPSPDEQHQIADFLDHQTAKIDALIAAKRELIERLQEKRAALISHAVTRGLNPDVEMRDSGVEWLGEIPAHWELLRLKFVCQINPPKSDIAHLPDGYEVSFLPMELIGEDGTLSLTEMRALEDVWAGYTYFAEGDVLVAKITPCFENGKGGLCSDLTNELGFGTTELHVLRPRDDTDSKFIFYLTRSTPFRVLGITSMKGVAGQQRVTSDFVENFWVAIPPSAEQRQIADFLDSETASIDRLTQEIQDTIEYLQEYRMALISATVTGKIDVREWMPLE